MPALLTASASQTLVANDALRLAPASQWNMQYNDDSCRLARTFGEGEAATTFYIERYEPGEKFTMVIAGAPLGSTERMAKVALQFGPGQPSQTDAVSPVRLGQTRGLMLTSEIVGGSDSIDAPGLEDDSPPPSYAALADRDEQRFAEVSWLSIGTFRGATIVLDLGDMTKPMARMRDCTRELITHWGIDAERHATLSRKATPIGSPGNWLTYKDYPSEQIRKGQEGFVQFRLMIDDTGKPSSCHIQQSTRPQSFDDAVCGAVMKRARFKPALDAQGKPLASYFRSNVRFSLPG